MTRRRRYLSVARTVAWRNLHMVVRAPGLLLPPLVFPLFFYMAFAGGLSTVGDLPGQVAANAVADVALRAAGFLLRAGGDAALVVR